MMNGAPPSSGGDRARRERLSAARGSVRDALGSLRNLEQLLRSIKVGPRALASVIPAVHASCSPLHASFRELLAELAPLGEAPLLIEAFVTPRLAAVEAALAEATAAPVHARQRLALEAIVARAATELETGRALVDLLDRARSGPATTVSLEEVTRSADRPPDGAAAGAYERVSATLSVAGPTEAAVNPRVAAELVGIAIRLVAGAAPGNAPHVRIGEVNPGEVGIVVKPEPTTGEGVHLFTPRLIEPTLVSAQAAAAATHGSFVAYPDGTVVLSWPGVAGD